MKAISRLLLTINAHFLLVIFRQCSVVHGDGPGGLGEILIKGLLAQVSILCFILFIVSLRRLSIRVAGARLAIAGVCLTTAFILFSFMASLFDACSDGKGICRNWDIIFAHKPSNSFEPPLRDAAQLSVIEPPIFGRLRLALPSQSGRRPRRSGVWQSAQREPAS